MKDEDHMSETTPEASKLRERLADEVAFCLAKPGGLPLWMQTVALGRDMRALGDIAADALLPVVAQEIAAAERRGREEAFAGAADNPGPDDTVPTPAQLLRRLFDGSAEQRIEWAHRAIENSQKIHRCFMQNHDGRIAYLHREVRELRAALAEPAPKEGL